MRTLSHWTRLLKVPLTIECPSMQVLGYDHEPPLFSGPGSIFIRSRGRIEFVMHATPRDASEAFKRVGRAQNNPHSLLDQFRIIATEYDGTEWSGGWTTLRLGETIGNVWRLSGPIHSLTTGTSGHWVAPDSSIEVVYDDRLRLPIPMNMTTSVVRDGDNVLLSHSPGRKVIEVAGTQIEFFHDAKGGTIWGTAKTSAQFPHPHAENWISEPLCLLLGQLVFPQLIARNFGEKKAMIRLQSSPTHNADTLIASILMEDPYRADDRFWDLYREILMMIVTAKDDSGHRNFEAHPLTQYYHEIVQATTGSHWVLCMTLASVTEGIAKLLMSPEQRKSNVDPTAIQNLTDHIAAWTGDRILRDRAISAVTRAGERGIAQFMRTLCRQGKLEEDAVKTWLAVRNQVMHGNLVSPWLDQELKAQLERLTNLTHSLALLYVQNTHKCSDAPQ